MNASRVVYWVVFRSPGGSESATRYDTEASALARLSRGLVGYKGRIEKQRVDAPATAFPLAANKEHFNGREPGKDDKP